MKYLTLIRHAKTRAESRTGRDYDRLLNPRGMADAARMGQHLREAASLDPDVLITSPAARAFATSVAIAQALGYPVEDIRQESTIYEAPVQAILKVLGNVPDKFERACLVGHNPGLEMLTNFLTGKQSLLGLVTCGVVTLSLNITSWEQIGPAQATLLSYEYPETLWGNES